MGHSENEKSNGVAFDLGEGWIPIDYIVLVKCLAPNGQLRYREMTSPTMHPIEALGMLTTMEDTLRTRIMMSSRPVGSGNDDPWSDDE